MLTTVADFRTRVTEDLATLVRQLQEITCRYGVEEADAWGQSLPKLSAMLSAPSMQALHLYYGGRGDLSLEYPLPASASWADVVLLGAHQGSPSAVIIELKHWMTRADRAGKAEGLIERQGVQELHPSEQVRGYVNYCQRFHSAVQESSARVHGCVLFTRDYVVKPYTDTPNERLATDFPLFTLSEEDCANRVPDFFKNVLTEPHSEFAQAFERGKYRQDRGFVKQIAAQILGAEDRPFELLDNQRRAFALCRATVHEVVNDWTKGSVNRRVIVVKGPPGSGKSAVAARLWADVSLTQAVPDGDIVFATTSMSQNTNWSRLFANVGPAGARGVIRKATSFSPVSTTRIGRLRQIHGGDFLKDVSSWREHLQTLRQVGEQFHDGAGDLQTLITIVDEAHSLINTERAGGIGQFGFATNLGPQAYHIIRSSALSIFFTDPDQGFRHRENTSVDDLRTWAKELGAGEPIEISLEGVQFRCAGSVEYVAWLEALLGGASAERNRVMAAAWHMPDAMEGAAKRVATGGSATIAQAAMKTNGYAVDGNLVVLRGAGIKQPFDFRVFSDPISLEETLRQRIESGATARLLSTYSRKWRTGKNATPHDLPPSLQDFHEVITTEKGQQTWSRVWNVVSTGRGDYSYFVQGIPGSATYDDPLCEVGCPYAVRGFDYDYVGVLWLEDLRWRNGHWLIDVDHVHESGVAALAARARRDPKALSELQAKIAQAYRIILTRALKGAYVWIKDAETREHVSVSLQSLVE